MTDFLYRSEHECTLVASIYDARLFDEFAPEIIQSILRLMICNLFAKAFVIKLLCDTESNRAHTQNGSLFELNIFITTMDNNTCTPGIFVACAFTEIDGEGLSLCSGLLLCNNVLCHSLHFRLPIDLHLLSPCFDKQLLHNFNFPTR